jgi:Cu/Ag efflux pump CusA
MAATPWEEEGTTASYLEAIGSAPTQGQIAALLLHFGYLLLVPALFGLFALTRAHGGKLRAIGGFLAVLGLVTLPGLLVVDFYAIALYDQLPLDQAVEIEEAAAETFGAAIMTLTGALPGLIGFTLVLVAAWRAGALPVAAPALWFGGWIVSFTGIGGMAVAMIVGSVVVLAGLVLAARAVLDPAPRAVLEPQPA